MSNFVEKIGEKLHIGGHKKEGEPAHPPPPAGYAGEHPPHSGEQGGHAQMHGGEHGHAGCAGGAHGEHHDQHGVGAPPPQQHEGPFEKVKHKIKGKKGDGGEGGDSSSSSSESDGEGGRRKKKHGIF